MIDPNSEAYKLLYCDDDGELIMIDEVQLIEPVPTDRVEPLRAMLDSDDIFASYQATLVLAAWADPAGLDAAANHIENNIHEYELSPHRLGSVDTAYDEIARALSVGYRINATENAALEIIERTARTLLERYEHHYFAGGMRSLMNDLIKPDLVPELTSAIERTISIGKLDQAAELLEPISRIDPAHAWQLIDLFRTESGIEPRAQFDVCDALAYIHTTESKALLHELVTSTQSGVTRAAKRALDAHPDG